MLWGFQKRTLCCVVDAKVCSSVDDNALHWHIEALVQTFKAIRLEDLRQAVSQALELTPLSRFTNISGKSRSGKVEGVDKTQRGGPCGASGCQVTCKVSPELCALVHSIQENLLVLVLKSKVEGLRGEVSDDIGQVSSPEWNKALLFGDTDNTVDDALVLLVNWDLFAGMLNLKEGRKIPASSFIWVVSLTPSARAHRFTHPLNYSQPRLLLQLKTGPMQQSHGANPPMTLPVCFQGAITTLGRIKRILKSF